MSDWQQRVLDEYEELQERLIKLSQFVNTSPFDGLDITDRTLLVRQQAIMNSYAEVLRQRIARITA